MYNYIDHLYNSYLNEITDDFIRRTTGIDSRQKYHDSFYNPDESYNKRNKRVRAMLFRNLANQLKRITR